MITKEENLGRPPTLTKMTTGKCKQKGVVEGKWNKLKVGGGSTISM